MIDRKRIRVGWLFPEKVDMAVYFARVLHSLVVPGKEKSLLEIAEEIAGVPSGLEEEIEDNSEEGKRKKEVRDKRRKELEEIRKRIIGFEEKLNKGIQESRVLAGRILYEDGKMKDFPSHVRELEALKEIFPERTRDLVEIWVKQYNGKADDFSRRYPLSADAVWQAHRRTRMRISSAMNLPEPIEFRPEYDRQISALLKWWCFGMWERKIGGIIPWEKEPEYELLETEEDALFYGIKKYKLIEKANGNEDRESRDERAFWGFWDLRQKEMPRFVCPKLDVFR
jgi:hypothetical protein